YTFCRFASFCGDRRRCRSWLGDQIVSAIGIDRSAAGLRKRKCGGNRRRKLFVKFRRYFCLNLARHRRWKIYRTRELGRLWARPKFYARDYSENREHRCDRKWAADRPEPGIVLNVAQVQTRLC